MARLRFATFNMLHGMSLERGDVREADLRAAAKALDADVAGLQEVDRAQFRSGRVDQTAVVADQLGAEASRFVPALRGTPGPVRAWTAEAADDGAFVEDPAYGVGLVSRFPVEAWSIRRFPATPYALPLLVPAQPRPRWVRVPDEPRVAVIAQIDTPVGPLTVGTAHLSFVPGVNARQLRTLARWARTFSAPRVLLGDFNLPGAVPRRVTGWQQLGRVATYPSYAPRVQFDHVLGDGVPAGAVVGVESMRLPVSDHCALVVDLEL